MRALSPIISAVILLVATIAAGAIIYQYFVGSVETLSSKPIVFTHSARYIPELSILYVGIDNSGEKTVTVQTAQIDCTDGRVVTLNVNTSINAGEDKVIRLDLSNQQCTPYILVLTYNYNGKTYTTDPIKVR